jgi:hypothetical protein
MEMLRLQSVVFANINAITFDKRKGLTMSRHLFTATTDGWLVDISVTDNGLIKLDAGSGRVVAVSPKDILKALQECRKVKEVSDE